MSFYNSIIAGQKMLKKKRDFLQPMMISIVTVFLKHSSDDYVKILINRYQ
jgi:hypothetical protein